MCKSAVRLHIWLLLFVSGFLGCSSAKAADMTVTNLFPATNAVEVCADTKLWITFDTAPIVATSGNLQICKASDDSTVYQLTLQTLPSDSYGPITTGWPYQINLNGKVLNYQPFSVSGNTLEIYPSTRLEYNTTYYVKMTAGFCTDAGGNTSPAITDNTMWRFITKTAVPAADHDYTVALDGSGDFCTIQGAVDAVANYDATRTLIKIRAGTYREQVHIPGSKTNITWLGESSDTTIMAVYNREAFNHGSDYRMMIRAYADGFRMYNMTFWNTAPDNSGQAETIKQSGLQCIAENCKFKSYQDTLCLTGQMYVKNCYIEGDTDYIWGSGTVYFDKCEMYSINPESYITQPRAAAPPNNGFFIVDCNLTGPDGPRACYLGRTVNNNYPYCQSVYLNCRMPLLLIMSVGWKKTADTNTANLRWWEYKSVDPDGNLIHVENRVPYSKQLTDEEAVTWRDVNNVFAMNPWNPKNLPDLPTASWQPQPADEATGVPAEGMSLTWAAGAAATSHLVYFGTANPPEFVGEQMGTSFATGELSESAIYYWRVDEKNSAGTTTGTLWRFTPFRYICASPITSDLEGDCQVDLFDYALFANAWIDSLLSADLYNDGFLDLLDVVQFATDWLTCNREPSGECWQ